MLHFSTVFVPASQGDLPAQQKTDFGAHLDMRADLAVHLHACQLTLAALKQAVVAASEQVRELQRLCRTCLWLGWPPVLIKPFGRSLQSLHSRLLLLLASKVQRGVALAVLGPHASPGVEQHLSGTGKKARSFNAQASHNRFCILSIKHKRCMQTMPSLWLEGA